MMYEVAVNHYSQVGVGTGVASATPHQLILMLLEGALISANIAKLHMEKKSVQGKCEAISRAMAIIDEGLRVSLDKTAGGEIAENLDSLYEYMSNQLLMANLHGQTDYLDEVIRLLTEVKTAWEEITPDKAMPNAPAKYAVAGGEAPARRESQSYGKV